MRLKKPGLSKKSGPAKNTLFDCGIDDVEHRFVLQVDLARFGQPPTAWIDQDIDGAARRMQSAGGDNAADFAVVQFDEAAQRKDGVEKEPDEIEIMDEIRLDLRH